LISSSEFSGFRGEVSRAIFLFMELAAEAAPAAPPAGAPPCAAHTAPAHSIAAALRANLWLMIDCHFIKIPLRLRYLLVVCIRGEFLLSRLTGFFRPALHR